MLGRFVPIIHGAPVPGRPDEADTRANAVAIAAALERQGYRAEIVEIDIDLTAIERIAAGAPHVVFNLYEATRGDAGLSYLPCAVLEHLGAPYTGAHAEAYFVTLTKTLTKRLLRAAGLPTADWWPTGEGAEREAQVIVKSDREHASYGMDAGSVVPGRCAMAEIASRQARFGGRFIAERYIEGREFNVALRRTAGRVEVLPIPEIPFDDLPSGRPHIVDYEAKWDESSPVYRATTRRFGLERSDPALAERLKELARACWDVFGLAGYARVDFRVTPQGEPFILEVNANPCLAPDAGFAAAAAEAGVSYDRMIAEIVEEAHASAGETARSAAAGRPTSLDRGDGAPQPKSAMPRAKGEAGRPLKLEPVEWRAEVRPGDVAEVRRLVTESGMFSAAEVAIAVELVEERIAKGRLSTYDFVFAEADGELLGYACYGATPGTEITFDLYWIVVDSARRGRGLGQALLARVERDVARRGGEGLYADTSGTDGYAPTRAFYRKAGFETMAELPEFYRVGDAKIIYRKQIAREPDPGA